MEKKIETYKDDEAIEKYNVIKVTAQSMIESVKHAIVMMQLAKVSVSSYLSRDDTSEWEDAWLGRFQP